MIDFSDAEIVTTRNAEGESRRILLNSHELHRAEFSVFMTLGAETSQVSSYAYRNQNRTKIERALVLQNLQ